MIHHPYKRKRKINPDRETIRTHNPDTLKWTNWITQNQNMSIRVSWKLKNRIIIFVIVRQYMQLVHHYSL